MFKKLINSFWFTNYRKYVLKKIHSDIISKKVGFCCHVRFKGCSFICWKDLKEVRETLQTTHNLSEYTQFIRTKPVCHVVWFNERENRVAFLEECLEKFNENKQMDNLVL